MNEKEKTKSEELEAERREKIKNMNDLIDEVKTEDLSFYHQYWAKYGSLQYTAKEINEKIIENGGTIAEDGWTIKWDDSDESQREKKMKFFKLIKNGKTVRTTQNVHEAYRWTEQNVIGEPDEFNFERHTHTITIGD